MTKREKITTWMKEHKKELAVAGVCLIGGAITHAVTRKTESPMINDRILEKLASSHPGDHIVAWSDNTGKLRVGQLGADVFAELDLGSGFFGMSGLDPDEKIKELCLVLDK